MSWTGFGLWAVAGALGSLAFVSVLSIGIFVVPFAVAATVVAARVAPDGRNAVGLIAGFGVLALVLAYINAGVFDLGALLATGVALVFGACLIFALASRSFNGH